MLNIRNFVLVLAGTALLLTGCALRQNDLMSDPGMWTLMGQGELVIMTDEYIELAESTDSKGLMLISPAPIRNTSYTLRFEAMSVTEDTVLVSLLSLSDPGDAIALTSPEGYDGSVGWLMNETEGYFIAYSNKPHNRKPFIRKLPHDRSNPELTEAEENVMVPEKWYRIETGRKEGLLFLKIDGKMIVEAEDPSPYGNGHMGIRIRGTKSGPAICRIRNFTID